MLINNFLETGTIINYPPRKSEYRVVDFLQMKTLEGDWVKAMSYRAIVSGVLYVRPLTMFGKFNLGRL